MTKAGGKRVAPRAARKSFTTRNAITGNIGESVTMGLMAGLPATFMDRLGRVDVGRVADAFSMTKAQLAETTGLAAATMTKSERSFAPRAQSRVTEMLEIINRVKDWAGGERQAMAWYRSQPIPALDGRTSEALVKDGRAGAVRTYLDHLALGGLA